MMDDLQIGNLKLVDGPAVGAWIAPRLGDKILTVAGRVPEGYELYARIFHPAYDWEKKPIRWAEVAESIGGTAHRTMQWEALIAGSEWDGRHPKSLTMDPAELVVLSELLTTHTTTPANCYFGIYPNRDLRDWCSLNELRPLCMLGEGPDHIVLAGPLSAVHEVARYGVKPGETKRMLEVIWPADYSWFVATVSNSTLVGGSAELVKAIIGSLEFEAWQVEPTDSLAFEADKINGTQV